MIAMEPRVLDETLIDLEFVLDEDHGCEVREFFHSARNAVCSYEPVYLLRKTCDHNSRLCCDNYGIAVINEINTAVDEECPDCKRLINICWEVIPA